MLFLAAAVATGPAGARADGRRGCEALGTVTSTVAGVLDGATIVIANGDTVKLAGLMAPRSPVASIGDEDWPQAAASRAALADLLAGREVHLAAAEPGTDRYGARLAHVWRVETGGALFWINGESAARGIARVHTGAADARCLPALLAREAEARRDGRGLWALAAYRVMAADDTRALTGRTGRFEIVEGRVLAAGRTSRTLYLNFGSDWRRDFTIEIPKGHMADGSPDAASVEALAGKTVRVRGWIERRNGPAIRLDTLDELEIVSAGTTAAP